MERKVVIPLNIPIDGFVTTLNGWKISYPKGERFSQDELEAELSDTDVLVGVFGQKIDTAILDKCSKLKMIANYGAGYDNIDVEYCTKRGILVSNCPNPVTEPTAELAMALMLSLTRQVVGFNERLRSGEPLKWGVMRNLSSTLVGKRLGIIGMGAIGKALAQRAKASGMKIIYHNRKRVAADIEKVLDAEYHSLESLLTSSDVVSLNMPLTNETRYLIGMEQLKMMKSSAILINTARGAVVNEQELIQALSQNEIGGAGLDVFEEEPHIPEELLQMPNVVVMPHLGSATIETRKEMSEVVATNILMAFGREMPLNPVNQGIFQEWLSQLETRCS